MYVAKAQLEGRENRHTAHTHILARARAHTHTHTHTHTHMIFFKEAIVKLIHNVIQVNLNNLVSISNCTIKVRVLFFIQV